MHISYIVGPESEGKTVKYILKNKLELSERLVRKLKYSSMIFLNSKSVFVNAQVSAGDCVEAHIGADEDTGDVIPENIEIDIIYEDDCLLAVNKEPDMVVHPTFNHPSGTVANAVMHHMTSKGVHSKIRPVSRLDRDTSGIIIFAKNPFVQEALIKQMNSKAFVKNYIGVVNGNLPNLKGTIDLPISRKPGSIMLRQVSEEGSDSVTHYEVLEQLSSACYVKFVLETGRTHQIRVHCQAIGHPLVGDTLYSDIPTSLINRQALHSYRTVFIHPASGKELELTAPLPADMETLLEALRH
jgi:23S rRNA pseudouridine1911/1915/1917 synthase